MGTTDRNSGSHDHREGRNRCSNFRASNTLTVESAVVNNTRLGPISQNAILTPGQFLELRSQRAGSVQFFKSNQSTLWLVRFLIPQKAIPNPGDSSQNQLKRS